MPYKAAVAAGPSSKVVLGFRPFDHYQHAVKRSVPLHLKQRTRCQAGFGDEKGKGSKKQPRIAKLLTRENLRQFDSNAESAEDWIEVPDVDAVNSFLSKPIKPIIFSTGRAICLYKVPEVAISSDSSKQFYCSDANSTSFKYPLADANILGLKSGPAVEVKLCGTVYDLATGQVLSWCPKNNPLRSVLGSLKDKTQPEPLPVYPVKVVGSKLFVKLT